MTSSIYPLAFVANTPTITGGTNILSTPITITADQVKPGGGGIVRFYFSFETTGAANTTISVRDGVGTTLMGNLNADNNSLVVSDGYYRFDLVVEAGDTLNFRSTINIETINLLKAHLVQFGA